MLKKTLILIGIITFQPTHSMETIQDIRKGCFITFEGGEGAGKTTQTQLLVDHLRHQGMEVVQTREPGGTKGAEEIRNLLVTGDVNRWDPLTEALLIMAARVDHWNKVIQPALREGKWVICDRFMDSTLAYQGYGRGVDIAFLENLYKNTLPNSTPNRTYVFNIDPQQGLTRSFNRRNKELRFENMDISFHEKLHGGFLEIAKKEPTRCLVIDATQDIETIKEIIIRDIKCMKSAAQCPPLKNRVNTTYYDSTQ